MLDLTQPICQYCGHNFDPETLNHGDVRQDDHWPIDLAGEPDFWPPCLREEV